MAAEDDTEAASASGRRGTRRQVHQDQPIDQDETRPGSERPPSRSAWVMTWASEDDQSPGSGEVIGPVQDRRTVADDEVEPVGGSRGGERSSSRRRRGSASEPEHGFSYPAVGDGDGQQDAVTGIAVAGDGGADGGRSGVGATQRSGDGTGSHHRARAGSLAGVRGWRISGSHGELPGAVGRDEDAQEVREPRRDQTDPTSQRGGGQGALRKTRQDLFPCAPRARQPGTTRR